MADKKWTRMQRIPDEDIRTILNLYTKKKKPKQEIAAIMGVNVSTVRRITKAGSLEAYRAFLDDFRLKEQKNRVLREQRKANQLPLEVMASAQIPVELEPDKPEEPEKEPNPPMAQVNVWDSFRGKTLRDNRWLKGDFYRVADLAFIVPHATCCSERVAIETVGQNTHMFDVHGTRIFEGDIVRYDYGDGAGTGVVYWDSYHATFAISGAGALWCYARSGSAEVIGNVTENPDLLLEPEEKEG